MLNQSTVVLTHGAHFAMESLSPSLVGDARMKNAIINLVFSCMHEHSTILRCPIQMSRRATGPRELHKSLKTRDSNVVVVKCIFLLLVRLMIRVGSYRNAVAVHVRATCTWHNCGFAEKE